MPAGPFEMGAPHGGFFAYDNERPRHVVDLPAYEIDATPVTNGAYRAFIEDGGYQRRELWSEPRAGTGARANGVERPGYWTDDWQRALVRHGRADRPGRPRDARLLVRGRRLRALARRAAADRGRVGEGGQLRPGDGSHAEVPVGRVAGARREHANLDQTAFRAASPGAFPAGDLAGRLRRDDRRRLGVDRLVVRRPTTVSSRSHTSSTHRCSSVPSTACCAAARGRPATASRQSTFRNWDYPMRRQLFCGFRCARDVTTHRSPPQHARRRERSRSTRACPETRSARSPTTCARASARQPYELPPKYFYDERGSELFDAITELDEYYPTVAERAILNRTRRRSSSARSARELVELGSGSASKTRALLYAMAGAGNARALRAGRRLPRAGRALRRDPDRALPGPRRTTAWSATSSATSCTCPRASAALVAMLGGTIGNFPPEARAPLPDDAALATWARPTGCCSAPTWSRTSPRSRPPTTTRRA